MIPKPKSLLSGDDGEERPTLRQRLSVLKYVLPLLKLVYETHRGYTISILVLRVTRAFVPLGILWVGKLIIDEVVAGIAATQAGGAPDWRRLGTFIAMELGIAVVGEGLARLSALLESLLGDLFGNRISVRLMEHAATLDLSQFEDAETYDHLERARRQSTGRVGLFTMLLTTTQDLFTLSSLGGVLLLQQPWLLLLLAVAVLPAFLGEAHFRTWDTRSSTSGRRSGACSTISAIWAHRTNPPKK
jgi:ATP-binding cassette subfamily B protein